MKRFLKILAWTAALALGLEAFVLGGGMVENSLLATRNPASTAFIRAHEKRSGDDIQLSWLALEKISRNLQRAIILSEDEKFYQHDGIDRKELKASWEANQKKGKLVRGGSTITMQTVKNLYFSKDKNPLRKFNEILLALDLEKKLEKKRILEIYLNIAEWGPGVYGAQAASLHYFNKDAGSLNASEAAYLAAILPNPFYLTQKNTRRAHARQARILRRM